MMINIDFKAYFRDRIWFGWKCDYVVHLHDGGIEANWRHSPWIIHSLIPVVKRKGKLDHFKEDYDQAQAGVQVYTQWP